MSRIIVLDVDPPSRTAASTFSGAGLLVELVPPNKLSAQLQEFQPNLLWVNADVGSALLGGLLGALEAFGSGAPPVVLVSADSRDAVWVRQFATGVVEVLKGPFNPSLHLARLKALLAELPNRSGTVRGRSSGKELAALFEHLGRTRRDARLSVAEGTPEEARLWFLKGRLKDANGPAGLKGPAVQSQVLALVAPTPWSLAEGPGADSIVEMEGLTADDEPFILTTGQEHPEVVGPAPSRPSHPVPGSAASPFGAPTNHAAASAPPLAIEPLPPEAFVPPSAPRAVAGDATPEPFDVAVVRAEVEAPYAAQTPLLFVDDDETIVRMFSTFFSKKGYPVAVARDGVEAMQQLTTTAVEVVIADLNMPRLDGWGLLKALREDFRTHELRVALFSAHDDYREQLRAMHAGAQAYYSKGLKLNALELQVRELGEPRRRFQRLLEQRQSVTLGLSALGPQWMIRTLAAYGQSVQLDAFDGWSTWRLYFSGGRLQQVTGRTGSQTFTAFQALRPLLCSRSLEGSFAFLEHGIPSGFGGQTTEQVLGRAVAELNEEQRRARDELLRSAQKLEVNPELHQLYVSVGPPAWQPIVKALCEEQALPRDVMARFQVTPQEMAAVLKDLLRRGVVTLTT